VAWMELRTRRNKPGNLELPLWCAGDNENSVFWKHGSAVGRVAADPFSNGCKQERQNSAAIAQGNSGLVSE
jgi:hypothetical protein